MDPFGFFKDDKDNVVEVGVRKNAKHRIRKGSYFHKTYPVLHREYPYAYWAAISAALSFHRTLLNNSHQGLLVVLFADSGTGKTSAIKALIHGKTGVKPLRSLTLRFISFNCEGSEQSKLNTLAKRIGFPLEDGKDVAPGDLAQFVVEAVTGEEKAVLAAAQAFLPAIKKLGLSMCGSADLGAEDNGIPLPFEIMRLPVDDRTMANARIRTKPIILFDDVNSPLEKNGPFGSFIYGVSQLCQESNVICYVLTNNRQAAS